MPDINAINLIRSKTTSSAQLDTLNERLSLISRITLGVFFVSALVAGGVYFFLINEKEFLSSQQDSLSSQIAQNATKEGLYISLKQRITTVGKALPTQRSWSPVVSTIENIVRPPALTSLALDEQNRVQFTLKATSLDEVVSMVNSFLTASVDANLRDPQLVSFQLLTDGTVQVVISCVSVG